MKLATLFVLTLSLLLAACGEKPADAPPAAAAPLAVGVVRFAELGFHPEREAPATVLGKNETRIAAEASARIAEGLAVAEKVGFAAGSQSHVLTLLRISGAIDREARTVEARYRVSGVAPAPGTVGRLVWRDPRPHIPADYILRRNGR